MYWHYKQVNSEVNENLAEPYRFFMNHSKEVCSEKMTSDNGFSSGFLESSKQVIRGAWPTLIEHFIAGVPCTQLGLDMDVAIRNSQSRVSTIC